MTDQQSANMMSCAGNKWLETPNLDNLASQGVRFDRAYAANPVCVPSRFSLQTSLYPSIIKMRHNGSQFNPNSVDDIMPHAMGHTFRNAGYQTVYGGKIHLPGASNDTAKYGYDYLVRDEREELADACAEFLQNRKKEDPPLFMFVSFINPHDICYHALRDYEPNGHYAKRTPPPLDEALKLPKGLAKEEFFDKICPPLPANHFPSDNESDGIQQLMDKWDDNNIGKGLTIDGNTIHKKGDGQSSAFLTNVVSEGVHIWKFKANHLTKGNWNPLGIWKINSGTPIINGKWIAKANNGYAYRIGAQNKINPADCGGANGGKYGVFCKTNDIIEMIVDFNEKSLSYNVNDVEFGKAFDIEATEYRAAFNCHYNANSITLISYETK